MRKSHRNRIICLLVWSIMLAGVLPAGAETTKSSGTSLTEFLLRNEPMERNINVCELKPEGAAEDNLVPLLIFVHGATGSAYSLLPMANLVAKKGIAAITFECCGGTDDNPQSDGAELYPAHYSSRISDLEAVIAYAKTLDYVNQNNIFLLGESYGGITVMLDAPHHNEDIAGIIIQSSGLSEARTEDAPQNDDGTIDFSQLDYNGVIDEYIPESTMDFFAQYTGDVMLICGTADYAWPNTLASANSYMQREVGTIKVCPLQNDGHGYAAFMLASKNKAVHYVVDFIKP